MDNFNILSELDDKQIDFVHESLRNVWFTISQVSSEIRSKDDDYMSLVNFCLKVSIEHSKRHGL